MPATKNLDITLLTSAGERIGKIRKINHYSSPGFSELILAVEPDFAGLKRIENAARDGIIVVDGLDTSPPDLARAVSDLSRVLNALIESMTPEQRERYYRG